MAAGETVSGAAGWQDYVAPKGGGDWQDYQAQPSPTPQGASPSFWDRVFKSRKYSEESGFAAKQKGQPEGMPGVSEGAGLAGGLAEWDKASGGEIAGGVGDILQGDVSKGLHRIFIGTGHAMTPALPILGPGMIAAPVTTALTVGGAAAGGAAAKKGAEALGASPEQAQVAGDVGNLAGGYGGGKLAEMVPGTLSRLLLMGKTPSEAYQSALKPPPSTYLPKVQRAISAGLQEGIPVSKAGVEKLSSLLEDLQDKVSDVIQSAGPNRQISPTKVSGRLSDLSSRFANQVNPKSDLAAIESSREEFLDQFRTAPGQPVQNMTAQEAQAMKQGTYQVLGNKAYGELKSAQIESQKALARGLKEELANAFPELNELNARESKLYDLQDVLERAVKRIDNHQIMGIGTPVVTAGTKAVTGSNKLAAAAGIFKAVLDNPSVKSRLAIALSQRLPQTTVNARIGALLGGLGGAAAISPPPGGQNNQQ